MTDDLLTAFRSEIPPPDEATARQIHERATAGRHRLRRGRVTLGVAGVTAIGTALAAVAVTGTFDPGKRPIAATGEQSTGGMTVTYSRKSGTLSSIAITLNSDVANASIRLQVVHSDASSYHDASTGSTQVVFQEQVSTTPLPPSYTAKSTWSGTLSPSDWNGGCESGLYDIQYLAIPPGRTFANATETPGSEYGAGEWFSCTGG